MISYVEVLLELEKYNQCRLKEIINFCQNRIDIIDCDKIINKNKRILTDESNS